MAVSFTQIPANIRNPLAYVELSNARAGTFQQNSRTLLIGQSINNITEAPILVAGVDWAKTTYGAGSHIAQMVETFKKNNSFGEVWVLPLNDAGGSAAATAQIAVTANNPSAGTIALYIGHKVIYVPVLSGDTQQNIGTSFVTAITNDKDNAFTATNSNAAYQEVAFSAVAGGTSTGLVAGTTYLATITVDGVAKPISALGSSNATYTALLATINTALGASGTAAIVGNAIRVTSATTGATTSVSITNGATPLFAAPLANFTAISPAVVNTTVTLTAKNKGTLGNKYLIQHSYHGAVAGEVLPTNVTLSITQPTGGATDPVISSKLPLIGDMDIAFYATPYADTTSLQAFDDFLTARWNALVGKDGQAFTAVAGTSSFLASTLGVNRNDEFTSIIGYEATNPTHPLYVASAYVGKASESISIDPARTLQTLELANVATTAEKDRFNLSTRATLLNSGISTLMYKSGNAQIERWITTYQRNSFGQPDNSYLDGTTMATLSYIKKSVTYLLTQKFPRHKLAADGTNFGAGQAIVTPSDIKGELIAWYLTLEQIGLVQNIDAFEKELVVELNVNDPNRVDIILPPVLVNNLIVAAVRVDFRLQA